mgnify:CR=1 FL=1
MNFVYISPHFPAVMQNFCIALRENGVTVLGIGDAPYETLSDSLRGALQEYYRVNDMENYDQMLRAVAYFTFKYGKIDDRRRKTRRKKTPVENILRFAGERCKDESVVSGNSLFQQRFRQ